MKIFFLYGFFLFAFIAVLQLATDGLSHTFFYFAVASVISLDGWLISKLYWRQYES